MICGTFPTHWGKPPGMQTCDVVRLPLDYGWGSGTLKAWIEYHMEQDQKAAVEAPDGEEAPMTLTAEQRDIMRHALGRNRRAHRRPGDPDYRNHYVTAPGCDGFSECVALEEAGLMSRGRTPGHLPKEDVVFMVTDEGKHALGEDRHG